MNAVAKKILDTIVIGLAWSAAGVAAAFLTMPSGVFDHFDQAEDGLFRTDFARRWGGGCAGWTTSISLMHVIADCLTWSAYVVIAVVIARLHPIMQRLPSSKATVPLIVFIFSTCGAVHLGDAYTTFVPMYVAFGCFKFFAAIIGLVGAFYISHNLVSAFAIVTKEKQRLSELEEQVKRMGR